jgi:hypothetical protein
MVGIDRRCQGSSHFPSNPGSPDYHQGNSGERGCGGYFGVVWWCVYYFLISQWPDLHTERQEEARREAAQTRDEDEEDMQVDDDLPTAPDRHTKHQEEARREAAKTRDRVPEGNEDEMQVDGNPPAAQDVGPNTSSPQHTPANDGGLFFYPKMKRC